MSQFMALVALFLRVLRPSRGLHAAPRGTADLVQADRVPAPRTTRVQADGNGADRVPVPRTAAQEAGRSRVRPYVPHDVQGDTRGRDAEEHRASLVRPYLVHWEREQERARVDRSRLGMAVLLDIATEVDR